MLSMPGWMRYFTSAMTNVRDVQDEIKLNFLLAR
jgi:hypothetical protein